MKAAVFHALRRPLAIETVAEPEPKGDEVLLRVGRCGICGSDLHMTEEPAFGVPPGTVLGHEFAGEIVALGKDASGFKVGDRVAVSPLRGCGRCPSCLAGETAWCAQRVLQGGGYAEFAVATDRQCLRLPSTTSLDDGALVEPLAVALHGVSLSNLAPGSRVLVMGAGPIGLGVTFWARRRGASKVAVLDLNTLQRDLAYTLGATDFIQADADSVAKVHTALGGPPDVVFECVGRPGVIASALEHVRVKGTIVMMGLCTAEDSFVPFRAVSKEARLQTSAFFTVGEYQAALDALDGGKAPPHAMITDIVALADLPPAFEALRKRTTQCKVIVRP